MGRYTFLDEIALADCAMEIEGESLNDLFETAAVALAQLMVDPATVTLSEERSLGLEADAVDMLLYDWLSELIFLKDRDSIVFPRAEVRVRETKPYRLDATVRGGAIDPPRTTLRADPKAVTLHEFVLERRGGGWWARVVVDI
jgi:SHS2 domain-containing protein